MNTPFIGACSPYVRASNSNIDISYLCYLPLNVSIFNNQPMSIVAVEGENQLEAKTRRVPHFDPKIARLSQWKAPSNGIVRNIFQAR